MSAKQVVVTTSWDDGHKLDLQLATLLKKYGIKGTFYVSPKDREFDAKDRLTNADIKNLAKDFEIGAHTMTHPRLTTVSLVEAKKEITASKKALEKVVGKKITSFCYPGGVYSPRIKQLVREAGFSYARTVERFWTTAERGAFDAPTTMHAYRHWSDTGKILRFAKFRPLRCLRYVLKWDELAIAQFEDVRRKGGIYHLWGHSWEIDANKDWARLERVLAHISAAKNIQSQTNAGIAKHYNKRPRLLMAASYFPPYPGGLEVYLEHIGRGLSQQSGWEVYGVASHAENRGWAHTKDFAVYYLKPFIRLSNTPLGLSWPWRLRKLMHTLRPDLVNVHMPIPGLADMAVHASGDIPTVVTYHAASMMKGGSVFDLFIWPYERLVLPRTLRRATRIVATSEFVRQDFLSEYKDKIAVITPGVSTSSHLPAKRPAKNTIIFVGNYARAANFKGVGSLLKAASAIKPTPKVILVGNTDIKHLYQQQARSLGIAKHITFTGALFGQKKLDAFHKATVLALPSLQESFPIVVAEALACGLPVVAYDTGGIKEMVSSGTNGYLVKQKDLQGLTQALQKLLQDDKKAQAFGKAGRKKAVAELDWSRKILETEAFFQQILNET